MDKSLIPPGLSYLADNITSKDNVLGASKEDGAKWAQGLGLPASGETIFFAGCGYQFNSKLESMMALIRKMDKSVVGSDVAIGLAGFQKKLGLDGAFLKVLGIGGGSDDGQILKDAVTVLRRLGIKPAYLAEKEPCCGGIIHYAGLENEFSQHARKVASTLESAHVKNIIGMVPSCTYTLRELILKHNNGSGIKVKHFCEVVADSLPSLRLSFPRQVKVAYHDPCQLVRYLGLIEEPRKILRAIRGIEFVEPKWTSGEWSTCCGGGGGFEAVFPEMSEMLATNRARELLETGAEIIVTHCPGCILQLKTGLKSLKADKVEVLDLAQMVALSVEG